MIFKKGNIHEGLGTFTTLWANSADDKLVIIFQKTYFSQKTESDISYKLFPVETICMECHILFFWKKKVRN